MSLRVSETLPGGGTQTLYTSSNPNALSCIISNVTPGCDFYQLAYLKCGYQSTEIPIHGIG